MFRTGVPVFVGFVHENGQGESRDERYYALAHWEQFKQIGRSVRGGFLEYAVRGFFENGGKYCLVMPLRVPRGEPDFVWLTEALEKLFTKDISDWRGILEQTEDADLICVPDMMMEVIREDQDFVLRIQRHVLEYCRDMGDRFAILDIAPTVDTERGSFTKVRMGDIEHAIQYWQELSPTEGALYFPWIRVQPLPDEDRDVVLVPPCGHIAGIYARSDAEIGVQRQMMAMLLGDRADADDDHGVAVEPDLGLEPGQILQESAAQWTGHARAPSARASDRENRAPPATRGPGRRGRGNDLRPG